MRASELKKYLVSNIDKIHTVLENTGFHDITERNGEIRCALPNMDNPTGVMIKLDESMYTSLFEIGYNGDFFGALEKVMDSDFKEVMDYIHNLLGLSRNGDGSTYDPLKELKMLQKGSHIDSEKSNNLYDSSYLNRFVSGIPASLIEEGISPQVIRKFNICVEPFRERIIFPHYDWIHNDKIVGIKGRTTQDLETMKLLNTPKYWNYIKGYRQNANLYGFNITKNNLNQSNMLIIFEAEKSVLKEYTYKQGKGCSVALGGHSISKPQVDFILKHTPINCEIVLAFDKDVMTKEIEGEDYIRAEAQKFSPFRSVSYIWDKYNLLGEKDSPVDRGVKIWKHLLKWRKKLDAVK